MPRKPNWPDVPSFLEDCFHWRKRGYAFKYPPPVDLMDERALEDPDRWIVIASVLEHAKHNDFSHIHRVHAFALDKQADPTLVGASLDLISDTGSHVDLNFLANMMLSEDVADWRRVEACFNASYCGELWLVEYMLECWKSLERKADRDSVDVSIRGILEPEEGGPLLELGSILTADEYSSAITARYKQLLNEAGSFETAYFLGSPVDAPTLVWTMRHLVENDDPGGIGSVRRRFEPLTGVDCSSFYTPTGVDLHAVTEVLDEFEAQRPSAAERFEPGKRYFFGHPVPR
jgi:hypothetical protein